jgi:hypothetical protein
MRVGTGSGRFRLLREYWLIGYSPEIWINFEGRNTRRGKWKHTRTLSGNIFRQQSENWF